MGARKGGKVSAMALTLLLMTVSFAFLASIPRTVSATTHFVGGAGPGNYTTIQQAIFAAGTGDTVYVYNGTYIEAIEINKPLNLVGESRESTIVDGNGTTGDVIHISSPWVNISTISVTHTGSTSTSSVGVRVFNAGHCSISNVTISVIGQGIFLEQSDGNSITNNSFQWALYDGIYITLSDSNRVSRNVINSTIGRGVNLNQANWNNLSGNNISFYVTYGILLEDSHHNTMANETIWESDGDGIRLDNSNSNTITNSTLSFSRLNGISLISSDENVIRGNDFVSNGYDGIQMSTSTGNSILHNGILSSNDSGIALFASDNGNEIATNTVVGNERGIHLWSADDNVVYNNDVYNNTEGIYLEDAIENVVSGNNVSHNAMHGVYIDSSSVNSFAYNNVSDNSVGFYTNSSSGNWIYHNSIVGNLDQAFNSDNTNEWDFGYPQGGNYWSDYVGVDVNMGPNQDVPGSDGIGDTPRPVDMGNQDRYPLMMPSPPPQEPPSPPRNLQASAGMDSITLTWDSPVFTGRSPIKKYNIYRGNTSGGEVYLDYVGTELTYDDTNVSECQTYFYQVTAENDIGESLTSNEANATVYPDLRGPADADAYLSGGSFENVMVTWTLSPDEGVGCGFVVRYEVYRGASYHPDGIGYQFVGSVPNATWSYVDSLAGDGDPNAYFYRVCAVSSLNDTECTVGQAAKFTRPLAPGPNLVSVPLAQLDVSIGTVLQTVRYDSAWYYDGEWRWHTTGKTYSGGLSSLNRTMGIWVNVTRASNLTVAGVVPAQTEINLYTGWNLVSFPSINASHTVADLKVETGATRVEGYDPAPPYFLRVLGDAEVLQAGYGYWVKVEADTIWTVSFE